MGGVSPPEVLWVKHKITPPNNLREERNTTVLPVPTFSFRTSLLCHKYISDISYPICNIEYYIFYVAYSEKPW